MKELLEEAQREKTGCFVGGSKGVLCLICVVSIFCSRFFLLDFPDFSRLF